MRRLNHNQLVAVRTRKRNLEIEVAKALNLYFKKHHLYSIQRLVHKLVEHILTVPASKLNPALAAKRGAFLTFVRGGVEPSTRGLKEFLKREMHWTLENCSDLIRLFGEINEKWKDLGLKADHADAQEKLRSQPTFVKVGSSRTPAQGGWGTDFGHRDRSEIPEDQRESRGAPYANIAPIVRGVEKFRFEPKSVMAAIDRTFGLCEEGGDVSGTTTDSIYALHWAAHVAVAGAKPNILNAIQLLPIVTMVPQGHHTIVECAYPLSRRGYIDYHIGYYSSLAGTGNDSAAAFGGVLSQLDSSQQNEHVLIWGRDASEEGALMEGDEIPLFKRMTRVLSAYGYCVAGGLRDFSVAHNVVQTFSQPLAARFARL